MTTLNNNTVTDLKRLIARADELLDQKKDIDNRLSSILEEIQQTCMPEESFNLNKVNKEVLHEHRWSTYVESSALSASMERDS